MENGFYYEKAEQETVITTDEIENEWNIFTRQSRVMTKLKNKGIEPYKIIISDNRTISAEYKLPYSLLGFRNPTKVKIYSEAEKQRMREQLVQNRK
jgi:hypothetical protein